jgi:biotin carboxyl carrier protein
MKHSTSSSDSHPFSSDFKVTNLVTNAHLPLGHPSLTRGFRVVRVNEHDFMVMGPDVQECLKRSMAEPVTHHNGMLQKHLTEVVLQPDGASLPMKVLKTKDAGLLIQCFGEILRCDNPELPWELRYDIMGTSQDSVLTAPMAGKVLEVQLAESQRVEKGVLAFVLESMKMQLEIKTTLAGVVEEVYVKAGDMLSSDLRLAKLKPHSL